MRVFPLLDLQAAEFVNQKARPGAGLHVQFRAAANARRTLLQRELHDDLRQARARHRATTPYAPTSVAAWRFRPQARSRRAAPWVSLWEGMDDPETV